MPRASPTRLSAASSTLHPLGSTASPGPPFPLSLEASSSSTSSRAPSPVSRAIRSRRPLPSPPPPHPPHPTRDDSADVTRPSLRKATQDTLGLALAGQGSTLSDSESPHRTRAASEGFPSSDRDRDREVVVHNVLKNDTLASVSLQYGITQQALRKANRLWATDPIHLRRTLLIPLDECNLPSSSFGLERVAREENGDITVWRREDTPSSPSKRTHRKGLHAAAGRSDVEHRIVSPTARRLISMSSFDTLPNPHPATNDFLAIWDDTPATSSRPSLDSVRSYTSSNSSQAPRKSSYSPHISSYLSSGNDPYSSSSAPLELSPPLAPSRISHDATTLQTMIEPDYASQASISPSQPTDDNTPPPEDSGPPPGPGATLSKRTLKVERLPASHLSFFPPPNPSSSSSSSTSHPTAPSSPGPPRHLDQSSSSSRGREGRRREREDELESSSQDLFFRPLAASLAESFPSLRGLNKYLPTSLSSSGASSSSSSSNARGQIALPLSRTSSPNRYGSTTMKKMQQHDANGNRNRNGGTGVQFGGAGGGGWNLDYFGGEEEQAAAAFAALSSSSSSSGRPRRERGTGETKLARAANVVGVGVGPTRRTSEIGLEDRARSSL